MISTISGIILMHTQNTSQSTTMINNNTYTADNNYTSTNNLNDYEPTNEEESVLSILLIIMV